MKELEVNVEKFNDKIYICVEDLISLFENSIQPSNTETFNGALQHFSKEIKEIAKLAEVKILSP